MGTGETAVHRRVSSDEEGTRFAGVASRGSGPVVSFPPSLGRLGEIREENSWGLESV